MGVHEVRRRSPAAGARPAGVTPDASWSDRAARLHEHLDEHDLFDGHVDKPGPHAQEQVGLGSSAIASEFGEVRLERLEARSRARPEVPVEHTCPTGAFRHRAERGVNPRSLNTSRAAAGSRLFSAAAAGPRLPVGRAYVILESYRTTLSGREGLIMDFDQTFDVVIVGSGAAGLSTALGAARRGGSRCSSGGHGQVGRQHGHVGRRHVAASNPLMRADGVGDSREEALATWTRPSARGRQQPRPQGGLRRRRG